MKSCYFSKPQKYGKIQKEVKVLLSAKLFHHILDGLSCAPQSSGIYSGLYDESLHRMYIPYQKFQLFFQFLLEILIEMVYNILVVSYWFQLTYATKKTAASFFRNCSLFCWGLFYSPMLICLDLPDFYTLCLIAWLFLSDLVEWR